MTVNVFLFPTFLFINILNITFQVFLLKSIHYLQILLKFISSLQCYVLLGLSQVHTFVRPKKKRARSSHNFIQLSSMKLSICNIFKQQDEDCVSLTLHAYLFSKYLNSVSTQKHIHVEKPTS